MKFAISSAVALGSAALIVACTPDAQITTGTGDYAQFCASCHGPGGKGDGPLAAGLTPRPTDLTQLSRANGGVYPRLQVMNRIDGYTMGKSDSPMPQFGEMLQGRTVMFDAGDGIETPTPWRLVALQKHVETLQE
ncbi:c-type cytochrome [uncultured Paracoccus sp.]|uniref:c-type cytochrome n=1 Tax=uncultured Paracoccus sp. TaxID=189685 RepID=UPI0026232FC4|nr:c-type cytochrome [uncultured Paracoccus sp.]